MDNNASNTKSHKFFKLWLNYEKPAISLKNLLKQELLSVLNLHRYANFQSKFESLDTTIDRQLILLSLERQQFLLQSNNCDLPVRSIPLCYSCPIGLILAPRLQMSPDRIVEDIGMLLRHSSSTKSNLPLYLNIDPTGWLNFYITEPAIACWLNRSLWLSKTPKDNSLLIFHGDRSQRADLFSVGYIHARCCSLLRLAAREKLIALANNFDRRGWQLIQPSSISWLDRQHHLWFDRSEYNLLRQLSIVTDSQTINDRDRWCKLALNLSQTTAIFLADCRFLGEIKEQYPEKAIARLGLIALTQYWLQKILTEKLNTLAPTTL